MADLDALKAKLEAAGFSDVAFIDRGDGKFDLTASQAGASVSSASASAEELTARLLSMAPQSDAPPE